MSIENILHDLTKQPFYENQIIHIENIPKKPPIYGDLQHNLHPKLHEWLISNKYVLYSHQTEAIDSILEGNNVVLVTSTASGKSLAYSLPVLHSLLNRPDSCAIYLFPQKALAQDQYEKLTQMMDFLGIDRKFSGIYDGDTSTDEKRRIRQESRIIITNPYGFHYYLPYKNLWTRVFSNLKYIIIDEISVYRGIFGSNFAQVIRRFLRVLASFNTSPTFILCSATIKNPLEVATKLTGQEFKLIDRDGSPDPGRYFVMWDLPMEKNSDIYKSAHSQTRYLFNYIVQHDMQTLAFVRSRKMAELNAYYSRMFLERDNKHELIDRVISYRAGLKADDRRRIEQALRDRNILGVYSTTALELGVDIGSLDCTILSGFPGTISSMWQQIGRAGRSYNPDTGIECLSFLIPLPNPLDLYYVNNPHELMSKPHEICHINLDNKYILENHLKCAAKEAPLTEKDEKLFGKAFLEAVESLEKKKIVKKHGKRYYWNGIEQFPPRTVSLNSIRESDFQIIIERDKGRSTLITYEEQSYVYKELHEGAIYLYMAEPYRVHELDLKNKVVKLSKNEGTTYTRSRVITDILQRGKGKKTKSENGINVYYGDVRVSEQVVGYDIISMETNERLARNSLNLPSIELETKAIWFSIPPEYKHLLETEGYNFDGAIHAIEHAAISITPYFTMCDRWDIGGVSTRTGSQELDEWPVIYIYDGFVGGIGIAESLYDVIYELLKKTYILISTCKCKKACPGCVISPKCGNNNQPLDKYGGKRLLELILKI
ncbi:MAG: DEAD/DEAH box helicase [Candidatus Lokiarchaeota archaeon]|nr:DEAD/DEAH box helicase [Candidatus Lokiarchaeota archaeon]